MSYIFFDTAQIPCGDDTLAEELAHSITPEDLLEESSWVFRITHHLPDSRQEIIAEHIPYYAAHTLLPRHRMGDYPIYPHARAHAIERVLTTKDERMTVHYLDERPEQTLSQLIETMNAVLAEEPTPASSDSR